MNEETRKRIEEWARRENEKAGPLPPHIEAKVIQMLKVFLKDRDA